MKQQGTKPKAKRNYKKKAYRKKGITVNAVKGTSSLISPRLRTKMLYASEQIATTTTTTLRLYQFRSNSLYDPDLTGTGHQPMGYDQITNFYTNWRVYGVKITVEGLMLTGNTAGCLLIGFNRSSVYYPADLPTAREDRDYKCIVVNNEKPFKFTRYFDIAKSLGMSKTEFWGDDGLMGNVSGTNPAKVPALNIMWQNLDQSTSTGWNFTAKLEYYVMFSEPRQMGGS